MPTRPGRSGALLGAVLALAASPALAASYSIGAQHFADGSFPGLTAYDAAVAGQPAPFNGFIGSDYNANFTAGFSYAVPAMAYASGSLSLGIFDSDSAAPGNQVAVFSVNGLDLTAAANAAFNGQGGAQNEYDVYSIALSPAVLASLASGTANVTLTLTGPGLQDDPFTGTSTTPDNGAGLDFATLTLTPATTVPEPPTWPLAALGALAAVTLRRRQA